MEHGKEAESEIRDSEGWMLGEVSHKAARVACVENPAERFCEIIGRIEDTFDVTKGNMAVLLPILDGEVLYLEMTDSISGMVIVDDLDGSFVVFKKWGRRRRWKTKIGKDGSKIDGSLRCGNSSNEFRFSGTGGSGGLCLGFEGDSSTRFDKRVAHSGSAILEVVGMGSINKAGKIWIRWRKWRESVIMRERNEGVRRESRIRNRAMKS